MIHELGRQAYQLAGLASRLGLFAALAILFAKADGPQPILIPTDSITFGEVARRYLARLAQASIFGGNPWRVVKGDRDRGRPLVSRILLVWGELRDHGGRSGSPRRIPDQLRDGRVLRRK